MNKLINMFFRPSSLYSKVDIHNIEIDKECMWIDYCKMDITLAKARIKQHEERLKELSFMNYLRTGKFLEDEICEITPEMVEEAMTRR